MSCAPCWTSWRRTPRHDRFSILFRCSVLGRRSGWADPDGYRTAHPLPVRRPVALLGLNNPIGIIFSGLFVAYLNQGGFNMQVYGFAPQVIDIIISVVIYFAAFSLLLRGFVERRVKRREEKRAADGRPAVSGRGSQEGGGAE